MTIPDDSLRQSLQELDVPAEFNSYDATEDAEVVVRLETWRQRAYVVLEDVRQRLRERENLAPQEQVEVVYKVAQFDGEGAWTVDTTRLLAQGEHVYLFSLVQHSSAPSKRFWSHTRTGACD